MFAQLLTILQALQEVHRAVEVTATETCSTGLLRLGGPPRGSRARSMQRTLQLPVLLWRRPHQRCNRWQQCIALHITEIQASLQGTESASQLRKRSSTSCEP